MGKKRDRAFSYFPIREVTRLRDHYSVYSEGGERERGEGLHEVTYSLRRTNERGEKKQQRRRGNKIDSSGLLFLKEEKKPEEGGFNWIVHPVHKRIGGRKRKKNPIGA